MMGSATAVHSPAIDFAIGTMFGVWLIKGAFPFIFGFTFIEALETIQFFY